MLRLESNRGPRSCDGLTRRDFLRVGGLAMGLSLAELTQLRELGAAPRAGEKACIQLFLLGGPSQLDTWDLKPNAPDSIRGPFQPIQTNVPGLEVCEYFPRMAQRAHRYALLRSIYHKEPPIHETGHQLLQTGRISHEGVDWPHVGAVLARLQPSAGTPPWAVLPRPIGNTGVSVSHGQGSGFLGEAFEPFVAGANNLAFDLGVTDARHGLDPARLDEPRALMNAVEQTQRGIDAGVVSDNPSPAVERALDCIFSPQAKQAFDIAAESDGVRERYGWNTFGQSCLLARRLIQHGVRLITVNMFDTVFNTVTWDCHANGGDLNSTLDDYRATLCPMFDQAYAALLDDLDAMGLLDSTLVVALGEFGRTPRLNGRNGRDHWPGVWSGVLAGGGVRGGQIIGSSEKHGDEPRDRPIHASEIAATVFHALGVDTRTRLSMPDGRSVPLVEAHPIQELF